MSLKPAAAQRKQVRQWTGIPVGVGIGPTKTLAKLANRLAKRHADFKSEGICNFQDVSPWYLIRYLTETKVEDVWGIGRKWGARLRQIGIESAQDMKVADPETMRRQFNVVLERTVRELNGVSCIPLEEAAPAKQQIVCSRSFGQPVTEYRHLAEALALHATRAAEKLRRERQWANALQVFIATNPFNPGEPQYHPALLVKLLSPTDDTAKLIAEAQSGLRRIYCNGFKYKKCGLMLIDLIPAGVSQGDLLGALPTQQNERRDGLLTTLDRVNSKMGRGTLRFAAEGIGPPWRMKRDRVTPGYTTCWEELPLAC